MAKRALLVGINRYKIPGADLRGCVNDVKNLKSALTRYYGFADKQHPYAYGFASDQESHAIGDHQV